MRPRAIATIDWIDSLSEVEKSTGTKMNDLGPSLEVVLR